jgi:hypothetical protein
MAELSTVEGAVAVSTSGIATPSAMAKIENKTAMEVVEFMVTSCRVEVG